jgi:hypothetical protein
MSTPKLPLHNYLDTGGKLELPVFVNMIDVWQTPLPDAKKTSSPNDLVLILGIRPKDESKQSDVWSDFYNNTFAYYHLHFDTFVVYDDSFTAIKNALTIFSDYIKNNWRPESDCTVSLVICGNDNIKDHEIYLEEFDGDIKYNFLEDLTYDIGLGFNFKKQLEQKWFVKIRSRANKSNRLYGRVRCEDPTESVYQSIQRTHSSKLQNGTPIVLRRVMDPSDQVPERFVWSHPDHWYGLGFLDNKTPPEDLLDIIWTLSLPLGLAKSFGKQEQQIIKSIILEAKRSETKDIFKKYENLSGGLDQNYKKRLDSWLTCWAIINWKVATTDQEKKIAFDYLLDCIEKSHDDDDNNYWKYVSDLIDEVVCEEAFQALLQDIPSDKNIVSLWSKLIRIIEYYKKRNTEDKWCSVSRELLLQFKQSDLQMQKELDELKDRVEKLEDRLTAEKIQASIADTIAAEKAAPTGLATKTDIADTIAAEKAAPTGLATKTDIATAITTEKADPTGLATKLDIATAIADEKADPTGLATKTDITTAITTEKADPTGLATKLDIATAIADEKADSTGLATKLDISIVTKPFFDEHKVRISDLRVLLRIFILSLVIFIIILFFFG